MENIQFKAMVVTETADKIFKREITTKSLNDLPENDVIVRVHYSSLNYKDALSAIGNKGVTKQYPHTPGIDAAGVVEESSNESIKIGEKVIVTSYDLGMNTSGGFGQYIRVPANWIVKLPESLTLKESMIYGTAGFTAGISVYKLTHTVKPDDGEILVTGSSGGVGSVAVSILIKQGYSVVAVSGKEKEKQFLLDLGVKEVISRENAADTSKRPLLKGRWAGVIDTVGGNILATAIKSAKAGGTITCCGNVASADLPLTVYPFILRGVSLLGVDSQNFPMKSRINVWNKLSADWKPNNLNDLCSEISLDDLDENIDRMLKGEKTGRTVVNLDA